MVTSERRRAIEQLEASIALDLRLDRIEEKLDRLLGIAPTKDFYSTCEVAEAVLRSEYTVREWCRLGRIKAEKGPSGRGRSKEWIVPKAELDRIRSRGLLPIE